MSTKIIGFDVGLAHCGIACVEVSATPTGFNFALVSADVIVTEKRGSKVAMSTTADNVARMRELGDGLHDAMIPMLQSKLAVSESQSWPRNAGSSAKIGMAWGVVTTLLHTRHIPLYDVSPQAIKLAVCGNKSASKDDVISTVTAIVGLMPAKIKKADREHACDAVAAVMAAVRYREDVRLWIVQNG